MSSQSEPAPPTSAPSESVPTESSGGSSGGTQPSSVPPTSNPPTSSEQPTTPPSSQPSEPSTSNPPTSSAPPPSSSNPPPPSSSDVPPPSSSPSTPPTSSPGPSSSAIPPTSSTPQPTPSHGPTSAPAPTSQAHDSVITSGSSLPSGVSATTMTSLSTDAQGNTHTITQVITNTATPQSNDGGHGGSDFFKNKGAVAGVFVVIGLVVVGAIVAFTFLMLRRRRRQRLDRDVSAAAAAAAAGHTRFEDEDEAPSMTQYGGYYQPTPVSGNSREFEGQDPQQYGRYDYPDPAGGYDPYAAHLVDMPGSGDRMSTATAGLAGFGAAGVNDYSQPAGHGDYYGQEHTGYPQQYGDAKYNDYALAPMDGASHLAEPTSSEGQGNHHYYNHTFNYQDHPSDDYGLPYDQPAAASIPRPASTGSIEASGKRRDLTVTNA